MGDLNEINLINAIQTGDKTAFQELIACYYPYVSRFLLKLCRQEALSEDLTQDTFVKLVRNIDRFDVNGKASFSTYVMTIAKNCYIDYLRKNKLELLCIDEFEIETNDKYFLGNKLKDLLKIIDTLPANQAEAIKLKYIDNFTLDEIAKMQNTQSKTVKSRIHNGVIKLRKTYGGGLIDG